MYPMAHVLLKAVNDEAFGFLAVSSGARTKKLLLMVRLKSGSFTS